VLAFDVIIEVLQFIYVQNVSVFNSLHSAIGITSSPLLLHRFLTVLYLAVLGRKLSLSSLLIMEIMTIHSRKSRDNEDLLCDLLEILNFNKYRERCCNTEKPSRSNSAIECERPEDLFEMLNFNKYRERCCNTQKPSRSNSAIEYERPDDREVYRASA
jgi:hypothetical protein